MKALTFTIRLLQPALFTQAEIGDPNSARSTSFVPGTTLRGALIGAYLRSRNGKIDAADPEFRRLFFDGGVRFLNGYPQNEAGRRMLPVPISWRREKDKHRAPVLDQAVHATPKKALKELEAQFCRLIHEEDEEPQAETIAPRYQVNIHTYRKDRRRQDKDEDTVFRYEALADGQTFGAVILGQHEGDLERLREFLENSHLSIGRSKSAGYGRVQVENARIRDGWHEYQPVGNQTSNIVVTCLSDVLLRDHNGAYAMDLAPVLNKHHECAFVRQRIVGGFNRKWQLPLPQAQAIRAGSVFVYEHDDALLERLRQLESAGIGERRVEGFGRIAVNWHRVMELPVRDVEDSPTSVSVTLEEDSEGARLAERMVQRMLRDELDKRLVECINSKAIDPESRPSNSQLSRLRLVCRQARAEGDASHLKTHLANLTSSTKKQIQRARITGDQSLFSWLEEVADQPESIWRVVSPKPDALAGRLKIGSVEAEFDEEMALEYAMRCLDGVLHQATKHEE